MPIRTSMVAGAALVAAALGAPVRAGEGFNPLGDGSGFNNPDLVRDPTAGCENCMLRAAPHEWDDPFFDLDWSLALRGAYVRDGNGDHFEALAVPSVTLTNETMRGGYDFSAAAELSRGTTEGFRVGAVRASLGADYRLDAVTALTGDLDLSLTQAGAGAPGSSSTIAVQPQVFSGDAEIGVRREFGLFEAAGRIEAGRAIYGPTTLADASLVDNGHQNNWRIGAGLRVGYAVTPILTAFLDGSAGYQLYDAASPSLLVKLDAADYQVRAGLGAKWREVLEAESSIGLGLRRFAEPGLGDVVAALYDASVTFRPDETLSFTGTFTTSIGAPGAGAGGLARIEYAAKGEAAYRVNPWLKLRASAGWRYAQLVGTTDTERGHDAGAGLDYLLNEHTTLTADYGYSFAETTPNPGEDAHRVTLGVTFSR